MSSDQIQALEVTAAQARDHLTELEVERALAADAGLAEIDTYMRDLEAEIDLWRGLYVTWAVTEIAILRAELFGRQVG